MKNLKKVLALVVALTMVLGTVSFAFTDVDLENDAYTAVQTLSSLNILNGYEDGTFGPEKDITRAEFAAVVCRALGLETSAIGSMGATQFTDVPADHWASGYINLAAGQGIINGMGDGTFEPESNVTYEQAVKMLVCALGFDAMAQQKGGYPTGYFVVANTYGLVYGIEVEGDSIAANRGIVAQLTYNALDIPMMDQTAYGTEQKFEVLDGTAGKKFKTLLRGLDAVKLGGVVTGTQIIDNAGENRIDFEARTNYNDSTLDAAKYDNAGNFVQYTSHNFELAEGVYADEYFGVAVDIFVREYKSGRWEVIAVMPGDASETISIEKKDVDTTASKTNASQLTYFLDENGTSSKKINLETTVNSDGIYKNNVKMTTGVAAVIAGLDANAEITLINNDRDTAFEMIIIKEYEHAVVDSVEIERNRLNIEKSTDSKSRITFDFEDSSKANVIVNAEGEAIELADLAEGDVIAYILDAGNGTGNGAGNWLEIIDLGENVVTGSVNETATDKLYVDGVEYETTAANLANLGDEGTFYLTKAGKVFSVEIDASVASNYGYILQMDKASDFGTEAWQIKLLTKDGSIVIYTVRDTFEVGYVGSDATVTLDKDEAFGSLEFLDKLVYSDSSKASGVGNHPFADSAADRIVTYKVNPSGKLTQIKSVNYAGNAQSINSAGQEYSSAKQTVNGKYIEDDAVIFNVSGTDLDDAFVTDVSALVDESDYVGYLVRNHTSRENDCFVITEGDSPIDLAQDFAVIDSVSAAKTEDGGDAWKVRYYSASEYDVKEVVITEDTDPCWEAPGTSIATVAGNLIKGTVVMFTADADGIASKFAVIATPDENGAASDAYSVNAGAITAFNSDTTDEYALIGGILDQKNVQGDKTFIEYADASYEAAITAVDGNVATIKGGVNAYTYNNNNNNNNGSKPVIIVDDYEGVETIDYQKLSNGNANLDSNGVQVKKSFFLAKTVDGIVTDIITFSPAR